MMDLKELIKERDTLKSVKAGVDNQLKEMRKSKDPNMNLAIRQFEELSWDLELDIYELDDIVANHMTVSRRYTGCKDVEYIDNVPHLH